MSLLTLPNYDAECIWGPSPDNVPDFDGLPFAPFAKRDYINHIANWDPHPWQKRRARDNSTRTKLGEDIAVARFEDSDENKDGDDDEQKSSQGFKHVKSRSYQADKYKKGGRGRGRGRRYIRKDTSKIALKMANSHQRIKNREHLKIQNAPESHRRKRKLNKRRRWVENRRPENTSCKILENWVDIKDIWFRDQFDMHSTIPHPRILLTAGSTHCILNVYDQLSCKNNYILNRMEYNSSKYVSFQYKSATLDPYIMELVTNENQELKKYPKSVHNSSSSQTTRNSPLVFTTDNVISAIMCCKRSRYSFDIVISKIGNNIFLDERSKLLGTLHVDETSSGRPTWKGGLPINRHKELSKEAKEIQNIFREQLLVHQLKFQKRLKRPNPFIKHITTHSSSTQQQNLSSEAFIYKKFKINNDQRYTEDKTNTSTISNNTSSVDTCINNNDIYIICRCTIDGHASGNSKIWMNIFTLHQYDNTKSKTLNWKKELDHRESSILLTEINNNNFKCARFAVQAYLSGSKYCKLGYIVRDNNFRSDKHLILGVKNISTKEWMHKNSLHPMMRDEWSILLKFLRVCQELEDGRYCAVREPLKQVIRVYSVNDDAFSKEDGIPTLKFLRKLVVNAKK